MAKAQITMLCDGPKHSEWTIILAHGAGAAMDTPFMEFFAQGLAERDHRVVRFEFPYMVAQRKSGKKRTPDREPVLRQSWHNVIDAVASQKMLIGGKSMGGRIATLIAREVDVAALICLGYPFHPTGKPDRLRLDHLYDVRCPALIVQGTRDPFGNQAEVSGYSLPKKCQLHWLEDGDHSFKPRKASGRTEEQNWQEGVDAITAFISRLE